MYLIYHFAVVRFFPWPVHSTNKEETESDSQGTFLVSIPGVVGVNKGKIKLELKMWFLGCSPNDITEGLVFYERERVPWCK